MKKFKEFYKNHSEFIRCAIAVILLGAALIYIYWDIL